MRPPIAVAVALVAFWAPAVSEAATRHTTPAPAGGADCSEAAPCGLAIAISAAASGDTVVVGAGTYGTAAAPIELPSILDPGKVLTIAGAVTGPGRPVVHLSEMVTLSNPGSTLRDLHLRGKDYLLDLRSGTADRVVAEVLEQSTGDPCSVHNGTLTNSLCIAVHPTLYSALNLTGVGPATVRNATLIGPAYGLYANAEGPHLITNSIFQAADKPDLTINVGDLTLTSNAFVDRNGGAPVAETGTVSTPPSFRAAGDHRQLASSSTVDTGADASAVGAYDLNGNLRKLGTKVDIGAFEHVPAPPAVDAPKAEAITTTTATITSTLRPQGGRMAYRLEYGNSSSYGTTTPELTQLGTTDAKPVSFALDGLAPNTTFHYRVVATTDGGTTETADSAFSTLPLPPTATASAATEITATTAKLTGTVDTQGAGGAAQFVVDGVARPAQAVSSGPVSTVIGGLTPGRTYTYTLVVTTAGGTSESAPLTFRTPGVVPPPPFKPGLTLQVGAGRFAGQLLLSRRNVSLFVFCGGVPCRASATGAVYAGKRRLGRLSASRGVQVLAGRRGTIRLRSSAALRRDVRRYMARNRRDKVAIRLVGRFVGADGQRVTRRLSVPVRRLRR